MKLLILDRDGTLNAPRDDFVTTPADWEPLPGALEAVARLNQAGWRLVIVSNQSGLGRGLLDMANLNAIHNKMNKALAAVGGRVDAIFYCPHAPEDNCNCRKPAPGLYEQIAERYGVTASQITKLAQKNGWPMRPAGHKRKSRSLRSMTPQQRTIYFKMRRDLNMPALSAVAEALR